jgi:metal-responsive CopG/Arc/MetJ family transcriptional regulator
MAASTGDNTKSRKPRPKQTGTLVGVRLQPDLLDKVDRAAKKAGVTRPEAIKAMIEKS